VSRATRFAKSACIRTWTVFGFHLKIVARKPKSKKGKTDNASAPAADEMRSSEQQKAPARRKSMEKKENAAARKWPAKRRASSRKTPADPTDEAIRIRAYFIAERRMRLALPGDPSLDWLEAKRQLLDEAAGSGEQK
jgi:hypothetical protein